MANCQVLGSRGCLRKADRQNFQPALTYAPLPPPVAVHGACPTFFFDAAVHPNFGFFITFSAMMLLCTGHDLLSSSIQRYILTLDFHNILYISDYIRILVEQCLKS